MTNHRAQRELHDTEWRLEVAEQKLRQAQNYYDMLVAKQKRLRKELGLDEDPPTLFDS